MEALICDGCGERIRGNYQYYVLGVEASFVILSRMAEDWPKHFHDNSCIATWIDEQAG